MSDADKEMNILMAEPIKIVLANKEILIKAMSVRKQFEAGAIFQEKPAEGLSEVQIMADRMIKIVSLATGLQYVDIDNCCTMQEVSDAFKAIWTQNGFDRFTAQPAVKVQA